MTREEPTPDRLTPRQLEVLELLAKGLTNREIGGVLGISAGTAKLHVSAIIEALEVSNRTEAAMMLQELQVGDEPYEGVPGFGERPGIAVLPFDPMSTDPEQELFADGLVEDLTTQLAAWRWFPVIARNTAFTWKGRPVNVAEVSRSLGARYVVEGSSRRAGNRVRINVQLIDGSSGQHVFAERFDRSGEDMFDVQDEIVETIVSAISPALHRFEQVRAMRSPRTDSSSWDALQRGLHHFYRQTVEEVAEAEKIFTLALEQAPDFAPLHAALSQARFSSGFYALGESQRRELDEREARDAMVLVSQCFLDAAQAGLRAVELDPLDFMAHLGRGSALAALQQGDEAAAALERALELNPSSANACFGLGSVWLGRGRVEEAIALLERAVRLSPRDPIAHHVLGTLAGAYFATDQLEASLDAARRSVALEPPLSISYRPAIVLALVGLGREAEAREVLDQILEVTPRFNLEMTRAIAPKRAMVKIEAAFAKLGFPPD